MIIQLRSTLTSSRLPTHKQTTPRLKKISKRIQSYPFLISTCLDLASAISRLPCQFSPSFVPRPREFSFTISFSNSFFFFFFLSHLPSLVVIQNFIRACTQTSADANPASPLPRQAGRQGGREGGRVGAGASHFSYPHYQKPTTCVYQRPLRFSDTRDVSAEEPVVSCYCLHLID